MTQSGHLINRFSPLWAPIPADMFVQFLQAKTYNPAFARWRIDAELLIPGLFLTLVDGPDLAVE